MKKKILFGLCFFAIVFIIAGATLIFNFDNNVTGGVVDGKKIVLYEFYGQGCPHCTKLSNFLENIEEKYPSLETSFNSVVFAVNEKYVTEDTVLKDGDVLAVIPPVGGG